MSLNQMRFALDAFSLFGEISNGCDCPVKITSPGRTMMSRILVVDNSAVNRKLMSALLCKNPQITVFEAESRTEVMRLLSRDAMDLMVTELGRPEADGMTLIELVRKAVPDLPVVLVTAHDSDDVLIEALRRGAASYVTKTNLNRDLLSIVQGVLDICHKNQRENALESALVLLESHYELTNDATLIPSLTLRLQQELIGMGLGDDNDAVQLSITLYEALINAMYHGNLELTSELLQTNEAEYWKQAAIRRQQLPFSNRKVFLNICLTRSEATYRVRDEGAGFDPGTVANPIADENLEKPSGRGLLLIRTFMDDVRFNDKGNEITLVLNKRQPGPTPALATVQDGF